MSKKFKLFCLPFAGGYASMFLPWDQYVNNQIELIPIELAGRGARIQEPLYENLKQAVNDIYRTIKDDLNKSNYAFFGHSLGAQLAYELYYKVRIHGHRSPQAMFLSAHNPPHVPLSVLKHKFSEEILKQELLKMGGTNPDLLKDESLLEMFMPILFSDFKMSETHQYKPRKQLIDSKLVILNGQDDTVTSRERLLEWQNYTNQKIQLCEFGGSHFFINDHIEEIMGIINNCLLKEEYQIG